MAGLLRKFIFIGAHEISDTRFCPLYRELMKNQWKSYDELKSIQEKRLRSAIQYAYENVPYYHALFQRLKLYPQDIRGIDDLEKLPILTRDTMKKNWEDFKPVNLSHIRYFDQMTGGSTGTPFSYRLDNFERLFDGALMYRGWGYAGYEPGDRMVILAGSSLHIGTRSSVVKKIHEVARNIRMLSSFDMGEKDLLRYVEIMNSFQPEFLRGYASAIYFFARWVLQNDITIHRPGAVFTTAEKLYPHMREMIERSLHCDVYDGYGLNDGGISAYECPEHDGLHLDTERGVAEVVDESGKQVPSGTGRILATSLTNTSMPFIRYETGDMADILPEETGCGCGRGYRLFREIVGRSADVLVTPSGKHVHGWYLGIVICEFCRDKIKEFQVVQESEELIRINIIPESNFSEEDMDKIRENIERRGYGWKLVFQMVDSIDRTRAGKYKWVINKLLE
jgi:phenylacetate-CoA ligase